MHARWSLLLAWWLLTTGCTPVPVNTTPEGAARDFIERLESFDGREDQAKVIYQRLSERSKANLKARSERYGAASGKKIEPWAMLVPARSRPRFIAHVFQAQIVGRHALVEVLGARPGEKAQVPCVFEDGSWRVDLVLPELNPLPQGPGHSP